jgi:opacity protein-like surface antigen
MVAESCSHETDDEVGLVGNARMTDVSFKRSVGGSKMKKTKIFLSAVCFLLILPVLARAEGFLDFYGGRAMSKDEKVEASISSSGLGFITTESHTQRTDFDPSFTFGGRGGYWFEKLPYVGFSFDVSYIRADDKDVEIRVVPISFLVMLRLPLFKSEKFPHGRIQPYAAIGPSLYYAHARADFRPELPEKISGDDSDVTADMRAGLSWQIHKHWAIFGEYRYTDIKIDFTNTDFLFGFAGSKESMKTKLKTNHALVGISYRF